MPPVRVVGQKFAAKVLRSFGLTTLVELSKFVIDSHIVFVFFHEAPMNYAVRIRKKHHESNVALAIGPIAPPPLPCALLRHFLANLPTRS